MLNYGSTPTITRIPKGLIARKQDEPESNGIFGILRTLFLVVESGIALILPETIPALFALATATATANTALDIVEKQQNPNSEINLGLNITINIASSLLPAGFTAFRGNKAFGRINNTIEELRGVNIAKTTQTEIDNILKSVTVGNAVRKQKQLGEAILRAGQKTKSISKLQTLSNSFKTLGFESRVTKNTIIKDSAFLLSAQADAEREAFDALKNFGELELGEITESSMNGLIRREVTDVATRRSKLDISKRLKEIFEFRNTKRLIKNYGVKSLFTPKFFSTKAGHTLTQNVQLLNPNDAGREVVNRSIRALLRRVKNPFVKLRNKLEKKFHMESFLKKLRGKWAENIVPVNSSWIFGVRVIKMDPVGEINTLIVYFKDLRYKPRFIRGVYKQVVIAFLTAPSVGSFYKRHFALSSNGRDITSLTYAQAGLFTALPLNGLRNIESIISNFKGTAKFVSKNRGDVFKQWRNTFLETISRNAPARLARSFTRFLMGGGGVIANTGGKFASATVKSLNIGKVLENRVKISLGETTPTGKPIRPKSISFNGRPLAIAGLTTIKTVGIKASNNKFSQVRTVRRYVKTVGRLPRLLNLIK